MILFNPNNGLLPSFSQNRLGFPAKDEVRCCCGALYVPESLVSQYGWDWLKTCFPPPAQSGYTCPASVHVTLPCILSCAISPHRMLLTGLSAPCRSSPCPIRSPACMVSRVELSSTHCAQTPRASYPGNGLQVSPLPALKPPTPL